MTNVRKKYFHIDKNASSEQIYALLDDVEKVNENGIYNLMNDSYTEFIAEEIIQPASTQDTFLTTPGVNLHVVPSNNQSKKKEERKKQKQTIKEVDQIRLPVPFFR